MTRIHSTEGKRIDYRVPQGTAIRRGYILRDGARQVIDLTGRTVSCEIVTVEGAIVQGAIDLSEGVAGVAYWRFSAEQTAAISKRTHWHRFLLLEQAEPIQLAWGEFVIV